MSQYEFKLPDIGEGVTEGEIVGWLVQEGDAITENQDMVEIMTDKATVTIGAPRTGRVVSLRGKQGDVIPVGQVLVVLDTNGGAEGPSVSTPEKKAAPAQPSLQKEAPKPRAEQAGPEPPADEDEGPAASAVGDLREALPGMGMQRSPNAAPSQPDKSANGYFTSKPLAAPATRRFARELGVDLRRVEPSGSGGRVTREDVERHRQGSAKVEQATARAPAARIEPSEPGEAKAPAPRPAAQAEGERVAIRGLRKRIYENMARSKHTAAHFTYVDECDATALRELRERLGPYAQEGEVKLSFLPFIVKATIVALKKHPALNCLVDDESHELVLKKNFDIGIAVATDAGLTVAALRDADRLSILDTAREIARLAGAARDNKLRKEDLGGTSFTITSLGKLGGLFATPIVNYPEVAILGVHEIKRRPVVKGDQIAIGDVMLLSLSFDHRVIDGHVGAAFSQEIISLLEDPDRLFVELT